VMSVRGVAMAATEQTEFERHVGNLHLQLIHVRHHAAAARRAEALDVARLVIAYANGAQRAGVVVLLQDAPCLLAQRHLLLRRGSHVIRPVQEHEVHIGHAELAQRCFDGAPRGIFAVVRSPELGGDKELLARHAGGGNRGADDSLVLVGACGIE
jgi:hypothetical protein